MAAVEGVRKQVVTDLVSYGDLPNVRTIRYVLDFDNVEADLASGDHLNFMTLPKGTFVLGGFLQQLSADTNATSDITLRVGTTAITGVLAGDAAVDAIAAAADFAPVHTTAAADVNVIASTAARAAGKVYVALLVCEGLPPYQRSIVPRDVLA